MLVKKFRDLKTSTKIGLLVGVSLLFLLLNATITYRALKDIEGVNASIYNYNLKSIIWLNDMIQNNRSVDAALFEMMVSDDAANKEKLKEYISQLRDSNNKLLKSYKQVTANEEHLKLVKQYEDLLKPYRQQYNKTKELAMQGRGAEAFDVYDEHVRPVRAKVQVVLGELVTRNEKLGGQQVNQARDWARSATESTLVICLISIIVSGAFAYLIVRVIVHPLREVQWLMTNASQGDLSIRGTYNAKDEIGTLVKDFNSMIDGLSTIIQTVNDRSNLLMNSSYTVANHARETMQVTEKITASMEDMSTGAKMQKQASKENAIALEEFARGIQSIVENSTSVADLSSHSAVRAEEGNRTLKQAIEQMNSIQLSVRTTASVIEELDDRSNQIGNIVGVMTGIAGQTNLLALNASIEAARAGESGRGFAVVAGEVRKLAEQSSVSAKQIKELIEEIQSSTHQTVSAMAHVQEDVVAGTVIVKQASEMFEHILALVQQVSGQIQEASAATEEMSAGTEEISASIDEMAGIAAETAGTVQVVVSESEEQLASIESISEAMDELKQLAEDLQSLVAKFKL
ncbi:methyl-accepting chemotaxis protein [Paenibacillus sp. 481]|nr:methyl-accepting chemotaxis protein [Paenibacillus sp. 481]